MKETIFLILSIGALLYIGLGVFLYFAQRSFLYQPTPEIDSADAQEIRVQSADVSLKIWQLNPELSKAIIYFGGNAENVYWNIPVFKDIFPDYTLDAFLGYLRTRAEVTHVKNLGTRHLITYRTKHSTKC